MIHDGSTIKAVPIDQARAMVLANLSVSNQWLFRGLVALYRRQTADEQSARHTRYQNNRGFNQSDARYLSWAAQQVLSFEETPAQERRFATPLNAHHITKVRGKMGKYAGQLARIAQGG